MSNETSTKVDGTNVKVVHTASLSSGNLPLHIHAVDSSRSRQQLPIGDETGLTKLGVNYCRLPPETISTAVHWHTHEDEWAYIVEAGSDAFLLLQEDGISETKSIPLAAGDFFGFPAGEGTGHGFKTGASSLVYLFGGSREPLDVTHYVESKKRRVKDLTGYNWLVKDESVIKEL